MRAKIIREYNKNVLDGIVYVEHKVFRSAAIEDPEGNYTESLNDKKCINIILQHANKIVGYLLAYPEGYVDSHVLKADKKFKKVNRSYYIDTMGILEKMQGLGGLKLFMSCLMHELKERGIIYFSGHFRMRNGLHIYLMEHYKPIKEYCIHVWPFYNNLGTETITEPAYFMRMEVK